MARSRKSSKESGGGKDGENAGRGCVPCQNAKNRINELFLFKYIGTQWKMSVKADGRVAQRVGEVALLLGVTGIARDAYVRIGFCRQRKRRR